MPYGQFKTVEEVARRFDVQVASRAPFVAETPLSVAGALVAMISNRLADSTSYINEFAICETIIRPILDIVAETHGLKVWSHVSYNVDADKGLVGEPDYLIAPQTKYGAMAQPVLCIIEAKKDDFDNGWAQALAEMIASALLGAPHCYGIVTTGAIWQFGRLRQQNFVVDPRYLSAASELQRVFNSLNWLLSNLVET